jgi:diguanylate cyclase (GGDEF)-like protein
MTKKIQFMPQTAFQKLLIVYDHIPENAKPSQNGSPFAESLRKFLEESGGARKLEPGEILVRQDDPAESMYWIESGVICILQGPLDSPRLLGFRFPGQVVGEIALLENIPRTASAVAILPTRMKSLSKEKFLAFLDLIPGVGVEIMRLLSQRLREVQPAEYSAGLYDHLTGALSRQAFDTRLQDEIKGAKDYRYSFSLVFLDLDHFKEINDTYGHARGDEVLVTSVQRIMADLRTTDLLFRYGGDEFVVILRGTDLARGRAMIQRMLNEALMTPIPGDPPINISFSAGIANFPEDGETPEALLKAADGRVYQAKRAGRGRIGQQ